MILRVLILGGLLLGFWLGLRRVGIRGRENAAAWLAIAVPLLARHFTVLQFARGRGFESRWTVAGRFVPPISFAILSPLVLWLPLLLRSGNCLDGCRDD